MGCNEADNQTKRIRFNLKRGEPYNPSTQMLYDDTRAPMDLTGYTFESLFFDKDPDGEGTPVATQLGDAAVSITGDPVNGIYGELLDAAGVVDMLDAELGPPTFWEFWATKDGVRKKWFIADVGLEGAGGYE